jgi:cell division protein FtsW
MGGLDRSQTVQLVSAFAPRLPYLTVAVAGLALLWNALLGLPPRQALERVEVTLALGETRVLGRHALGAPLADTQHVRLRRDADGAWWVANASALRALELRRDGRDVRLRGWPLAAGQVFLVAGERWQIVAADPVLVIQRADGAALRYDGLSLGRAAAGAGPLPACAGAGPMQRLRSAWNAWMPPWLGVRRPLRLGGGQDCATGLAVPALAPGEASIARAGDAYVLHASPAAARRICALAQPGVSCEDGTSLFEHELPLAGTTRMIAGRTVYAVAIAGDRLTLTVMARGRWQATGGAESPAAEPGVRQTWADEDRWRWPLPASPALTAALALLAAALLAAWVSLRRWGFLPHAALAFAVCTVAVGAAAAAYVAGPRLGVGWSLGLASAAVLAPVVLPERRGWVWASFALLGPMLLAGLAQQMQLGIQAADTGGWIYLQKTAALAALAAFAWQAWAGWLRARAGDNRRQPWPAHRLEALLVFVALLALAGLAAQAVAGGEEGVFGLQPVELAKFALLLVAAHALALGMEWEHRGGLRRWGLWWRMALPVALFMALVATALLIVRDFSPLVLMLGWLAGTAVAWALARGGRAASLVAALALATVVAGVYGVKTSGVGWMQAQGFYGDRFAVWLEPELHPHSGEQVLRALAAIAQADWLASDQVQAARIPAVQDDMAPAFFTGRFGVAAAWALLWTQLAYLGCLAMIGLQALAAAGPGDFKRRWRGRLLFFAAWGYAALFATHMAMSWGTNFGWLPVMGQPMPLLSAAGSLIVLFVLPAQALWLLPAMPPARSS